MALLSESSFRPIQKKIFAYNKVSPLPSGLSNNRIRSWFASLTQSILIRSVQAANPIIEIIKINQVLILFPCIIFT